MVKIFALPANEGDFIWVAYGENEVYSHILIDGGTDECGEEFASIISIIDERKEKIEALVLTHVDYDHIQGALEGICRISNDILDRTVKRIYFNTYQGIHRNLKGTGEILESSVCIEDQIRVNQNYKEYGVKDGIKFGELLSEKNKLGQFLPENSKESENFDIIDGAAIHCNLAAISVDRMLDLMSRNKIDKCLLQENMAGVLKELWEL